MTGASTPRFHGKVVRRDVKIISIFMIFLEYRSLLTKAREAFMKFKIDKVDHRACEFHNFFSEFEALPLHPSRIFKRARCFCPSLHSYEMFLLSKSHSRAKCTSPGHIGLHDE